MEIKQVWILQGFWDSETDWGFGFMSYMQSEGFTVVSDVALTKKTG